MSSQDDIREGITGEGLIAAIHSLSHKLMLLYSQIVYAQTGLNWQDWRILRAVVSLQSCRAQDICDECGLKKPHVSNGLARLEKAGHIRRTKAAENSRSKIVLSTEQGETLVEKALPILDGLNSQISTDPNSHKVLDELRSYQEELDRLAKVAKADDS
ncbi:MarR family transcriptional regulator [Epibacterium sp. SM1969]|uniref:MarR family transcriptional regulator n=1 Tax=Tritonibacter aquimaris TaxID=2663379 RepID=A0A844ANJ0_9RHOB|nr:MarR family winged helix-turn-helix transcriptional regulator [Tritonibacter aquimaris]MQY44195.1 MarR family transcriptional regulator [Tritonibacter aquimaris]